MHTSNQWNIFNILPLNCKGINSFEIKKKKLYIWLNDIDADMILSHETRFLSLCF